MTAGALGRSYLKKARVRRKALEIYHTEESWSDVVREAQELTELVLKGILRLGGIEPPKFHDVGPVLIEFRSRFPQFTDDELHRAADISLRLRRDREAAFYGDVDMVPSEVFTKNDSERALQEVDEILSLADRAEAAAGI